MDLINILPNEILKLILLDTNNINCKFTCKRWNYILFDSHIIILRVENYDEIKTMSNGNTIMNKFKNKVQFLNSNYLNIINNKLRYDIHKLQFQTKFFKLTEPIVVNEKGMSIKIPLNNYTCNNLKNIFNTIDNKTIINKKINLLKDNKFTYIPIVEKILCDDTLSTYEYFESSLNTFGRIIIFMRDPKWKEKINEDRKIPLFSTKLTNINKIIEYIPTGSKIKLIIQSYKYHTNNDNLTYKLKINIIGIECIPPNNYCNEVINYDKPSIFIKVK